MLSHLPRRVFRTNHLQIGEGNISGYTDNYIRVKLKEKGRYELQNQILPTRILAHQGQNVTGVNIED